MSTKTRFEIEAKGNSEMAYYPTGKQHKLSNSVAKEANRIAAKPCSWCKPLRHS